MEDTYRTSLSSVKRRARGRGALAALRLSPNCFLPFLLFPHFFRAQWTDDSNENPEEKLQMNQLSTV